MDDMPPPDVIAAAELVGRWFAERNIKQWRLGPCASREAFERLERGEFICRRCGLRKNSEHPAPDF